MKNSLFTSFIALFFFNVNAQDLQWTKAYEQLYGTQQEYKQQVELRKTMGYDLYKVIGYKSYYTSGPSSFLQQTQQYSMDAKELKGRMIYTLTKKDDAGIVNKLRLIFWLDQDDRVTKARISGSVPTLIFLFNRYWPANNNRTTAEQLTKGVVAEKQLENEKIIFNYTNQKPFIEINSLN